MADFLKGSDTDQIYHQLQSRGVSDEALDRGYHQISYSIPGPNEVLVGAEDHQVQEGEVYEYLFEHYEDYHDIIQGLTGKPVPWTLDDWDSKTDFDRELRAKVSGAIDTAKTLLVPQNIREGTEEYQEKLSVALFYFADFPDDFSFIKNNQGLLKKRTDELTKVGLGVFQKYLFEKGGLGIFLMKGDAPEEASAIESLKLRKGWCTERSKILFAVFKLAGLDPFFVRSDHKEMLERLKGDLTPRVKPDEHIFLGLRFGSTARYFDLSVFDSNVKASHSYPLRLNHYAAVEMANRGLDKTHQANHQEALKLYHLGLRFDPKNGYLYYLLGNAILKEKASNHLTEAIGAYQKSTNLESGFAKTYFNLGNIYSLTNDFDDAMKAYLLAVGMDPNYAAAFINMADIFNRTGRPDCTVKALQKALQADPKNQAAIESLNAFQRIDKSTSHKRKYVKSDFVDVVCTLFNQ